MALVEIIPIMTSNTVPAPFVASASSVYPGFSGYTFEAWRSFNPDNVQWYGESKVDQWLQIDLANVYTVKAYKITATTAFTGTIIKTWRLNGSNDGKTWDTVHHGYLEFPGEAYYEANFGSYRYWRIDYLTDNGMNDWASITQFQLYQSDGDADGDWIPDEEDYAPYDRTKWQRPTLPTTKWAYDFSFLTASSNPATDGQIGQQFLLSYLNSETGVNFAFRYKPYEEVLGLLNEQPRRADRRIERNALFSGVSNVHRERSKGQTHNKTELNRYTSLRWILQGIAIPSFDRALKYQSAIVEFLLSSDRHNVREGSEPLPMELHNRRIKPESQKLISELIQWGVEGGYATNIVESFTEYYERKNAVSDTLLEKWLNFQHLVPMPQAEVIGEWIIANEIRFRQSGAFPHYEIGSRPNEFDSMTNFIERAELTSWDVMGYSHEYATDTTQEVRIDTAMPIGRHKSDHQYEAVTTYMISAEEPVIEGRIRHNYLEAFKRVISQTHIDKIALALLDNASEALADGPVFLDPGRSINAFIEQNITRSDDYEITSRLTEWYEFIEKNNNSRDVRLHEDMFIDKAISREFRIETQKLFDSDYGKESYNPVTVVYFDDRMIESFVEQVTVDTKIQGSDAGSFDLDVKLDRRPDEAEQESSVRLLDWRPYVAFESDEGAVKVDTRPILSKPVETITYTSLIINDSYALTDTFQMSRVFQQDSINNDDRTLVDSIGRVSRDDSPALSIVDRMEMETQITVIDVQTMKIPRSIYEYREMEQRMQKVNRQSWINLMMRTISLQEKVTMIQENWALFSKVTDDAYHYNEQAENEIADMAVKQVLPSEVVDNTEKLVKKLKESMINKFLTADADQIDGYINTLIGAEREDIFHEAITRLQERASIPERETEVIELSLAKTIDGDQRLAVEPDFHSADEQDRIGIELEHSLGNEPDRIGIELEHSLGNEPDRIGIGLEHLLADEQDRIGLMKAMIAINAERQEEKQEAHVSGPYILSGDGSDWEDIWKRYSPGVDILDPPDSDFDYEKLAAQVYDLDTGVPKNPTGPTNLAAVSVPIPLHHPIPQNFDFGIDTTKELVIDNYILIDVILAIESIKNRNKLRYAGMPSEKTVRELFSNLFTWIQQAAEGNEQYDRTFRFARWYAESAILKLSKHVLHRKYEAWRSTYHLGEGLGIPSRDINWPYRPSMMVAETISTHAELRFSKENYIDGEIIIRGYFDNPANEGTMKIMVDGDVIDTFSANGAFTKTYEVPQGNHTYDLIFDGASGQVMLSTIEITGCTFVSAHTTSDDSDTNGLKAATLLISNLLSYYDLHHGDGKTKGTMQVKQRRVWNTQ